MLLLQWTVSLGRSGWWSSFSGLQLALYGYVARTCVGNLTLSEKQQEQLLFCMPDFSFSHVLLLKHGTITAETELFSSEESSALLTWPPPLSLLVSLTLLNDTAALIQCAPKFGESGWMYTQLGVWGSGLPPGTHSPFTYFHLWLSADMKSSKMEYMAFGSNPDMFTFSTGNMRLGKKKKKKKRI